LYRIDAAVCIKRALDFSISLSYNIKRV
jgi:hypothetical protein